MSKKMYNLIVMLLNILLPTTISLPYLLGNFDIKNKMAWFIFVTGIAIIFLLFKYFCDSYRSRLKNYKIITIWIQVGIILISSVLFSIMYGFVIFGRVYFNMFTADFKIASPSVLSIAFVAIYWVLINAFGSFCINVIARMKAE